MDIINILKKLEFLKYGVPDFDALSGYDAQLTASELIAKNRKCHCGMIAYYACVKLEEFEAKSLKIHDLVTADGRVHSIVTFSFENSKFTLDPTSGILYKCSIETLLNEALTTNEWNKIKKIGKVRNPDFAIYCDADFFGSVSKVATYQHYSIAAAARKLEVLNGSSTFTANLTYESPKVKFSRAIGETIEVYSRTELDGLKLNFVGGQVEMEKFDFILGGFRMFFPTNVKSIKEVTLIGATSTLRYPVSLRLR